MVTLSKSKDNVYTFSINNGQVDFQYNYHATKAYTKNKLASYKSNFVDLMVEKLKKVRLLIVHKYGFFDSTEYIEKWIQIAKRCPTTLIWCRIFTESDIPSHPDNIRFIYEGKTAPQNVYDSWVYDPSGVICPEIPCRFCLKCFNGCHTLSPSTFLKYV